MVLLWCLRRWDFETLGVNRFEGVMNVKSGTQKCRFTLGMREKLCVDLNGSRVIEVIDIFVFVFICI